MDPAPLQMVHLQTSCVKILQLNSPIIKFGIWRRNSAPSCFSLLIIITIVKEY